MLYSLTVVARQTVNPDDQKLVQAIESDMLDHRPSVSWEDIAGLDEAKELLKESLVYPLEMPELFTVRLSRS